MSSHKKIWRKKIFFQQRRTTILLQSLIMDGIVYFIVSTYSLWNFSLKESAPLWIWKINSEEKIWICFSYQLGLCVNEAILSRKYFIKESARDLQSKKVNDLVLNVNLFTNKFIKPESFYIKLNDSGKWPKKEKNLLP